MAHVLCIEARDASISIMGASHVVVKERKDHDFTFAEIDFDDMFSSVQRTPERSLLAAMLLRAVEDLSLLSGQPLRKLIRWFERRVPEKTESRAVFMRDKTGFEFQEIVDGLSLQKSFLDQLEEWVNDVKFKHRLF